MSASSEVRHGTSQAYSHGECRCEDCTAAHTLACKVYRVKRARGGKQLRPAAPARAHLQWLSERGVGFRRVAEVSGLSHTTVHRIALGQQDMARAETLDRIMAVGWYDAADGTPVPAEVALSLVDRLRQAGLSGVEIARQLGMDHRNVFWWRQKTRRGVTAGTARAVHQLARQHLRVVPANPW